MSQHRCETCGRPMPSGAGTHECLSCLLKVGLVEADRESEPDSTERDFPESFSDEEHIGRYRLLEPIGEGGCGTVWMAEQLEPVRRRVALELKWRCAGPER